MKEERLYRVNYLDRAPSAKFAGLFVACLQHFIGQPLTDGVHPLKHAVPEVDEWLEAFRHGVSNNVWLPSSLHSYTGNRDLLQSFLEKKGTCSPF